MRLIDADVLFDRVYKEYGESLDEGFANMFMGWINEAPTINPESLQPHWLKQTCPSGANRILKPWSSSTELFPHEERRMMKRGIEVWQDHDLAGNWVLHIKKARGTLSIEEIRQAAMEYEQDFYMLVIKALDMDMDQYYMTDDLDGDYVTLYSANDFFRFRDK